MDSRLDGIFRTTFRTAEQTDSRLDIRRDEDQHHKRKDKEDKEDSGEFDFDDDAHVSVSALYVFLRDLLVQGGVTNTPHTDQAPQTPQAPTPEPPPHDQMAQRASMAANAYQTTARSGTPSLSISDTAPPPAPPPAGQTVDLSADEIKIIQGLMVNLERLAKRGVTTLTIRKADTFLHSLQTAVSELIG